MIRYGIVGFGLHAAKRLMPGIATAANSTVQALSRRDLSSAQMSAEQFRIPLAFDSVDELCACNQVDAVFVSSPNSLHLSDVLTAVSNGKPVICEKPLGLTAFECRTMIRSARDAGVLLGVAQCFRFSPVLNAIRNKIKEGEIGRAIFARAEFSFLGVGHARKWMTDKRVAGGGPMMDVGVHCVDLLRYVLTDEVDQVAASATSDEQSGSLESSAVLSLNFVRGTLATVAVSTRVPYHTCVEVTGTAGTLKAENALLLDGAVGVELLREGRVVTREQHSNSGLFARQFDAFSEAVENNKPFEVPGEEALQNALVLDAAYRSIETGRTQLLVRD